jgi:MFS family permease
VRLAQSMAMLLGSRALQGIGGGITVTASALIGEVVPLRETPERVKRAYHHRHESNRNIR